MRKLLISLLILVLSFAAAADTYIEDSGTVRRIARITVEDAGTVRTIQRVYVEDSGVQRLVYIYYSADISPTSINTTSNPSSSATCNAIGGTGPFTYAWARISGDTRITANSTSSSATTFSRTGFALFEVASATFRCTITDTATGDTVQDTIAVTMERSA
jgi:hypothetical protein